MFINGTNVACAQARIASRPNPEIDIGAVDMSCAFILCDITSHDDPIVYVSDAFERLTGYTRHEILGRNCRFLQAPDGKVSSGIKRKYVDDDTVYRLREKIRSRSEVQVSMINYRKGGQPFMNLLTMIPIRWGTSDYRFYVGFQVDLVEQPQAVTKRNSGMSSRHSFELQVVFV
jgi:PAS domain S-box-containing protein